jgi:hypothetical protein
LATVRPAKRFGVGSLMGLVASCALIFAALRANPGAGLVVACVLMIAAARMAAVDRTPDPPAGLRRRGAAWATSLLVALVLVVVGGTAAVVGMVTLFFLPGLNVVVALILAAYFVAKARQALWPQPPLDEGITWLDE